MSLEKEIAEKAAEIVQVKIGAAIVEALGKDPAELIRAVTDVALSQKRNSYDRETIFQSQVKVMIQGQAKEAMKAWLEEHAEEVKAAIRERLDANGSQLVNELTERIAKGLQESFFIKFNLREDR